MSALATFIFGAVAGGATWELYKRFEPEPVKARIASLFRRKKTAETGEMNEVETKTAVVPPPDQLEAIHGIGPVYARRLNAAGIFTYATLAQTTPERILAIVSPEGNLTPDVAAWIAQANGLIAI